MAVPTYATIQPNAAFQPNSTFRPYSTLQPNFTLNPNSSLQLLVVGSMYTYPELVFIAVGFCILIVGNFFGNSLVLVAVARTKKLQNVTNAFVVNLSVADLLVGFALVWSVPAMVSKTPGYPLQSDIPCVAAGALMFIAGGNTFYSLANIALTRCILITRPKKTYQWLYTPKKITLMILSSWLIPGCATIIPPLCGTGGLGLDPETRTCTGVETHPQAKVYNYIYVAVFYLLPFVVITVSYLLIWRYVSRHFKKRHQSVYQLGSAGGKPSSTSQDICNTPHSSHTPCTVVSHPCTESCHQLNRTRSEQMTITKNLFVVVLAFLVCFTPITTIAVAGSNRYNLYGLLFAFSNGILNPLIYAAKHPHFAPVLRAMIRCRCSNNRETQARAVSTSNPNEI